MSRTRDLRQYQLSSSPSNPRGEPSRPSTSAHSPSPDFPDDPPYSNDRSIRSGSSNAAPPLRPQRSAARQPGIVVNDGRPSTPSGGRYPSHDSPPPSKDRYPHSRDSPGRKPPPGSRRRNEPGGPPLEYEHAALRGNSNRLYEAVSGHPASDRELPKKASRQRHNANGYLDADSRHLDDNDDQGMLDTQNMSTSRSRSSSAGSYDPDGNNDLLSPKDLQDAKRTHGARNVLEAFTSQMQRRPNAERSASYTQPNNLKPGQQRPGQPNHQHSYHTSPTMDLSYPSTPGFKEIERVLQKIKFSWERTGIIGSSGQDRHDEDTSTSSSIQFSPVGLALDLLESENADPNKAAKKARELINNKGGLTPSLGSFLKNKAELEKALQFTIQGNYRQFDASINAYNLTKANVENSYKKVLELRAKLNECRTTFGSANSAFGQNATTSVKGTEMKVFQSRREVLGEMLKLIDIVDQLKQVPDKLESLVASKKFLSATVLLVRSLKNINKPELADLATLADLRAYFVSQESVIFDILIEELHNHLYLKSYFCDNKWKPYRRGQNELPVIQKLHTRSDENLPSGKIDKAHVPTSSLQQYLNDLLTKPQANPMIDEPDLMITLSASHRIGEDEDQLVTSNRTGFGGKKRTNQFNNPELHSFNYIESLIESLAVLQKLGLGLDNVLQRVPTEIYALVENTLNEVDRRHEATKRVLSTQTASKASGKNNLMINLLIGSRRLIVLSNSLSKHSSVEILGPQASRSLSGLKISLNELNELQSVSDVLLDTFWTLYSKLDATLQSFRVLHEVSLRISERKDFKEDGVKSSNALFSLLEVWKPIQTEVKALVRDYLTATGNKGLVGDRMAGDAAENNSAAATRRNPMAAIADVLKIHITNSTSTTNLSTLRSDPTKPLFKFKDTGQKFGDKELKLHETNLDAALKASVPGLVMDSGSGITTTGANILSTTGLMGEDNITVRNVDDAINVSHRLLLEPDVFYVNLLLQPTLQFINRARDILPSGLVISPSNVSPDIERHSRMVEDETARAQEYRADYNDDLVAGFTQSMDFYGFLNQFVSKTFLPQLEDKVMGIFQCSISAPDAFQDYSGSETNTQELKLSLRQKTTWRTPVAKSLTALVALIDSLCDMIQSTPFHREKYGRLVVNLVAQYYQKCCERFSEMVAREPTEKKPEAGQAGRNLDPKLAPTWAQGSQLVKCLQLLNDPSLNRAEAKTHLKIETKIEQMYLKSRQVTLADLIKTSKKISALAHLYTTLENFMAFIRSLASIAIIVPRNEVEDEAIVEDPTSDLEAEFDSMDGSKDLRDKTHFRLPLGQDALRRLQSAHRSYRSLSQLILFSLRLELRLQSFYYIGQTFREGNFYLNSSDSTEPNAQIIELNTLISDSERVIGSSLAAPQQHFIYLGLGRLMNRLFIEHVTDLKFGNEWGFKKMYRNVVALQQNLKTFSTDSFTSAQHPMYLDFEPSRRFWEMASEGPEAVMSLIRTGASYSFEQYRHLLCLLCTIDPETASQNNVMRANVPQLSIRSSTRAPDAKSASFDKQKRIYNECLIELHALVMMDDEDEA